MMILCTEQAKRAVLNPPRSPFKGSSSVNNILLSQNFSFLLPGVYYSSWDMQKEFSCLCVFSKAHFGAFYCPVCGSQRIGFVFVCFLFQNNFTDTKILPNSTAKSWKILSVHSEGSTGFLLDW